MQKLLVELLSRRYRVFSAMTAQDALDLWEQNAMALVICERTLPDGSGSRLAKHGLDRAPETRIVLMSDDATAVSVTGALYRNVVDHIVKPIGDPKEVVRRVARALALWGRSPEDGGVDAADGVTGEAVRVHDPLTGLFDREYFQASLQRETKRAVRSHEELTLVFVDLDNFERINSEYGREVGDACLRQLAGLLAGRRQFSGPTLSFALRAADTAARYSGDRFALLLPDTPKRGAAVKAEQLRALVEVHSFLGGSLPPQTVSIGLAGFPADARDAEGLMQAALQAVELAKSHGRNQIVSFAASLATEVDDRPKAAPMPMQEAIEAIDRCISEGGLFYHYQPIVDVQREEIFGYEALCRTSSEYFRGPAELFGSAERTGRVAELGRAARIGNVEIMMQVPEPCLLFVNLHPLELNLDLIREAVDVFGPLANRLVFEITEVAAIKDLERVKTLMEALRGLGFRFALDDLGSGYAGLNSLALLEPDFVKLDMALIRHIKTNSRAARLIRHIIDFTSEEGVRAVAEGVETPEEFEVVKKIGAPLVQGYYFARPGPPFPELSHKQV